MADNRTMAQMLQAPIEGYEDAIVVPPINANNFELKQPLINLVQSNKFTDALDSAAGGNFLDKMPQEGLAIIESKLVFLEKNFPTACSLLKCWNVIMKKMGKMVSTSRSSTTKASFDSTLVLLDSYLS
ncbi:hypothetical protein Tco_1556470 [Tanacetum coccineum]